MAGIFVYGGCVTRDTFEFLKDEHTLTGYVARQSLVSAASIPTTVAGPIQGEGFEYRAARGDLYSSLYGSLAGVPETDIFIMDLLVERFGVFGLPDGSYVTRTPNLRKAGAIEALWPTLRHIKMGTEEHFLLWSDAATKLVQHLSNIGLLDRTLLFETPWASVTTTGDPVPPYVGWTAESAEITYAPYYAKMKQLGVQSTRLPQEYAVSTDDHRWGASPYHYIPAAYEWMRDEILQSLAAQRD